MVESKSANPLNDFNGHSEKSAEYSLKGINRLANDSERTWHRRFVPRCPLKSHRAAPRRRLLQRPQRPAPSPAGSHKGRRALRDTHRRGALTALIRSPTASTHSDIGSEIDQSGATAIEIWIDRRWYCARNHRRRERLRHKAKHQVHLDQRFIEIAVVARHTGPRPLRSTKHTT
jgi:hypothetical protein